MEDDDFQSPCFLLTAPILRSNHSRRKHKKNSQSQPVTFATSKRTKSSHDSSKEQDNIPPPALQSKSACSPPYIIGTQYEPADPWPSHMDSGSYFQRDLRTGSHRGLMNVDDGYRATEQSEETRALYKHWRYSSHSVCNSNSIESRILSSSTKKSSGTGRSASEKIDKEDAGDSDFEPGTQLDVLIKLCSSDTEEYSKPCPLGMVECPVCGLDISEFDDGSRQLHTNGCLDICDDSSEINPSDDRRQQFPLKVADKSSIPSTKQILDVDPVSEWLCSLGLDKYKATFLKEEIDWDTLKWLTEEDLINIGVTALGPRMKMIHALDKLRGGGHRRDDIKIDCNLVATSSKKQDANRLITEYFPGSICGEKKLDKNTMSCDVMRKEHQAIGHKRVLAKKHVTNGKGREIPLWCCIPGTPFRVDAFRYLRRDCSHWFLTHFHIDHYQGLTKSFFHGKIYCSLITAKLVNMKIGIPWDRLHVLPLNQKISIAGVQVTCFDANHCPGSIIILFEPSNGEAILHTGDFRFSEEMSNIPALQACSIHTLILDTTYCDPQYDFPKQEAVIQFVIEAIQAEAFNSKTLFLIGSYTVGKERLFLEVARVLRKTVYVTAPKLRLLECLELPKEDMQWFTEKEEESNIHVVPMWTLASFKRLKQLSNQYADRFSLVVAFSPTGWTFGKGKKTSTGRRWQQGTIVRYEVPYSEHCSFTELKEFVKFISPVNVIPSVNNKGEESSNAMISLLST